MSAVQPMAKTAVLAGHMRELSGCEEELAASWTGVSPARVADEALARCLTRPGEDLEAWRARVRALPVAERDRLLLELRRRSAGDVVTGEVDCPDCGRASELTFRISELPRPADVAAEIDVELPGGGHARLRPVTAGDQERLLEYGRGGLEDVLALVAQTSDGAPLEALDPTTRVELAAALDRANPDLDIRLSLACHACGKSLEAPLDVEVFFFDELRTRAAALLDDIHALAQSYHWSEGAILRLSWNRRAAYLRRIEADRDRALIAGLDGV